MEVKGCGYVQDDRVITHDYIKKIDVAIICIAKYGSIVYNGLVSKHIF